MAKAGYIINKEYEFRDNDNSRIKVLVQLDHQDVIDFAESFIQDEGYNEVDGKIKDQLDEAYVEIIAQNLFEEVKEENKTIEDFYEDAWDLLGETVLYYIWPHEFKQDCINYYNKTTD